MTLWTREHKALLAALRATSIVPPLVQRLSLERVTADDADVRRLRGWAASLREDPAWAVLEHVLHNAEAWPAAWDDAVDAGFSALTDHHHALLFSRFCRQYIDARDWEAADWTWRQCVQAWGRVFGTDYPRQLFDDVAPTLSEDGAGPEELLRTMLDELVTQPEADLREAAGLRAPGVPEVERRRLRFTWLALQRVVDLHGDGPDPHGTLERLHQTASAARSGVTTELLTRFEKSVSDLDLSTADGDRLLGPFNWVAAVFAVVGYSESAVTAVISKIVETCWALRRMGRDDIKEFRALLDLGSPFNENLFERLVALDSAFGHNSRCADFLVFLGERQSGAPRRTTFEAGLKVCPGHRNSAMLLSYELIGEATKLVAQVAVTPSLAAKVGLTGQRLEVTLKSVKDLLDEAEAMYPYNESLPDARKAFEAELKRLNVEL